MEWQPIETAPKDGTDFLAYYPRTEADGQSFVDVVAWPQHAEMARYYGLMRDGEDPTHWMPLPSRPK